MNTRVSDLFFLKYFKFRRRWKQIVEQYINSPHAESMRKRNWWVAVKFENQKLIFFLVLCFAWLRRKKNMLNSSKFLFPVSCDLLKWRPHPRTLHVLTRISTPSFSMQKLFSSFTKYFWKVWLPGWSHGQHWC